VRMLVTPGGGRQITERRAIRAAGALHGGYRRHRRPGRQRDTNGAPDPEGARAAPEIFRRTGDHARGVLENHKAGNHEEQIDADAKRRHRLPEGDRGIVAVDERDMRYDRWRKSRGRAAHRGL